MSSRAKRVEGSGRLRCTDCAPAPKRNVIQSREAAWNLSDCGSLSSCSSAGVQRDHTAIGRPFDKLRVTGLFWRWFAIGFSGGCYPPLQGAARKKRRDEVIPPYGVWASAQRRLRRFWRGGNARRAVYKARGRAGILSVCKRSAAGGVCAVCMAGFRRNFPRGRFFRRGAAAGQLLCLPLAM